MILGIYIINVTQIKIKSMNLRGQGLHGRSEMEEIERGKWYNYLIFLKIKKVMIFLQLFHKNLIEYQYLVKGKILLNILWTIFW